MSLEEYRRRRDFKATPEPAPAKVRGGGRARRFVIQLHHARARHFDFRLEHDGVLLSWAVPKGPSLRPADKRLAVQTEDHPLAYGRFEGSIPKGHYGAGDVQIVESGTWEPEGDAGKALAKGKLDFRLDGTHLQGAWTLVRTGPAVAKAKWLLIKRDDDFAEDSDLDGLLGLAEAGGKPVPAKGASGNDWSARALALDGARCGKAAVLPQLATRREQAPDGDQWLHEIKWDGYRLFAAVEDGKPSLQSRNAIDWTGRFPDLESALAALPVRSALIDAELVVLDEAGFSDFAGLQAALEGSRPAPISCVVFDLLALDGVDLTGCAQLDRKLLLRDVLAAKPSPWLAYGEHIIGSGPKVFARAVKDGHEGIISKRIDATYAEGRSQNWIKLKRTDDFDATVVGFTPPRGSRRGIGSLLLAVREADGFRYVGRVGIGLTDRQLVELRQALDTLSVPEPVLDLPRHVPFPAKSVHWVRPRLVIEVEHRGWGKQGLLRQASFKRLRPDKSARGAETPVADIEPTITHPDRIVFPEAGLTKGDVAQYYRTVAPWLLEEIQGRPLSLLRAPDGITGERFFQKHLQDGSGAGIRSLVITEKSGKKRPYVVVEDAVGLLSLVQLNTLELHPWGCLPGKPDRPDRITFDLDPGDGVAWKEIVGAAVDIRDHLDHAGLRSHALLSGGKGVHVVVPLDGSDGWPAVKRFARALAYVLAADDPDRFVAVAAKDKREGRIFVDWLRNSRGATSIAPWSLRARPGAPVAMPVSWKALAATRQPDRFHLADARDHTQSLKAHPWGDYRASPQRLPGKPPRG